MLTQPHLLRSPASEREAPVAFASATPVLDFETLARLRELDPTGQSRLMERVLAAFQASTLRLIPQLVESERARDLGGVRYVAHTLKSSAASVGGLQLSAICADLETRVRLGRTEELQPLVDALVEQADLLLVALARWIEPVQ
jgi:HPt (histidine-containing phosphotransfer) domain-containing protein